MTTSPAVTAKQDVDWNKLADRLAQIQAQMIHHENNQLHGNEFYAEALRRLFRAGQHPRAAELPYESIDSSTGMITMGEHRHTLESHTIISRLNTESAKAEAEKARTETRSILINARRIIAGQLREWTTDRTVPAKFRREGVLMAADWIDPDVNASPYSQ